MAKHRVRPSFALLALLASLVAACSSSPHRPEGSQTSSALSPQPYCDADCMPGTHCELVAYACFWGDCPPRVGECVPDRDFPTCATSDVKCAPGETCVDTPADCAPPAEGTADCATTVPTCLPAATTN